MRKPILAFLAIAFIAYWLGTAENSDNRFSLGTIIQPTITRIVESDGIAKPPVPEAPKVLAPPPVDRAPAALNPLQVWVATEALRIGIPDPDPARTLARLKQKSAHLDHKDLKTLKAIALDSEASADSRYLAVYMLGLANNGGAIALLKEVCFAQIPDKTTEREHSDEVILRTQGLEALVQRMTPREARGVLRELLSRTSDPVIARHAQYLLSRFG